MAVSLTIAELAAGMTLTGADAGGVLQEPAQPLYGRVARYRTAAAAIVEDRAPHAPGPIQDQAVIMLATYWHSQPAASRRAGYANALLNSGAVSVLAPWTARRAASDPAEGQTEATLAVLFQDALIPVRARLSNLEEAEGISHRTYTGRMGWSANDDVDLADFAAGQSFENGIFVIPPGGPGWTWFAVPSAEGFPEVIYYNADAQTGAWRRANDVDWSGQTWIVGITRSEIASRAAGSRIELEYTDTLPLAETRGTGGNHAQRRLHPRRDSPGDPQRQQCRDPWRSCCY